MKFFDKKWKLAVVIILCEGFCEADLSAGEISKVANGELVKKMGTCGQWKNFYSGCFM
ncbi:hypothetical protein HZB04_02645 [Candidatus Wolfebacteria bacterium]|nr:hypothetical protein [Candidatus Wolfebacteria bacterium]